MRRADQIAGFIGVLFSGAVIAESLRIPTHMVAVGRTSFAPPAGFLPMWAGIIMAALSMILVVGATLGPPDKEHDAIFPDNRAMVSIVILVVSLVAYIFLLDKLGYIIATFLLNLVLLRAVMNTSWLVGVGGATLMPIMLFVAFDILLRVKLPVGLWGF